MRSIARWVLPVFVGPNIAVTVKMPLSGCYRVSAMHGDGEEAILPFGPPRLATAVRSTVVVTSLRALRSRGHFERYLELLDTSYRDPMLALTAGTWLPIDAALAHYTACE